MIYTYENSKYTILILKNKLKLINAKLVKSIDCYCSQTLLKMKNEGNLEPMKKTVFLSLFEKLNIKGGMEIIEDFIKVFKNSKKKIDVAVMLDKYLELYPNTKL